MIRNYFKIAIKVLLRHKLFTFISLFGISFTLLVLVVLSSFIDHAISPNPPEKKQRRILSTTYYKMRTKSGGTIAGPMVSYYFLDKYVRSMEIPEAISISSFHSNVIVYHQKQKFTFACKYCDGNFWDIMDFNFIEGKPFTQTDVANMRPVAIISRDTRNLYFQGRETVGESMDLNGKTFRIAGVVENVSLLRILPYADVWLPITQMKADLNKQSISTDTFPGFFALLLARQRSDFPQIKAEYRQHLGEVEFLDDRVVEIHGGVETYFETLSRLFVGGFEQSNRSGLVIAVFILMLLFMLLPAINLVNINISRIYERSAEIGIRKAFGASSATLINQFITENVIITAIGGFLSLILALIVLRILNQSDIIPHLQLRINWRIFAVSLFITLVFGVFSGVIPAYRMARMQAAETLRGGEK